MAMEFPYEVRKCDRPLDEEKLSAEHHRGRELVTAVHTTADTDPHGPRYWYYFRTRVPPRERG